MKILFTTTALAALFVAAPYTFAADTSNQNSSAFCLNNPNNANCLVNHQYIPGGSSSDSNAINPDSAGAATKNSNSGNSNSNSNSNSNQKQVPSDTNQRAQ